MSVAPSFLRRPWMTEFDGVALNALIPTVQALLELSALQHGAGPLHQGAQQGKSRGVTGYKTASVHGAPVWVHRVNTRSPCTISELGRPSCGAAGLRRRA